MPSPLTVLLDSPQVRLKKDSLSTLVSGHDWDPRTWGSAFGTWVEPVGHRAMLEPAPINARWESSSTGIFAKWAQTDFVLGSTSSYSWKTVNTDAGGGFLQYTDGKNSTAPGVIGHTNFNLPKNQPLCFEMFVTSGVKGSYPIAEFGVSASLDGTSGVSFRLYGEGRVEVWKNGAIVGQYGLRGDYWGYYNAAQNSFGSAPEKWLKLIIIPCSDREILVVSPQFGGGFSHVFLDLEEGVAGQAIFDAAPFWFLIPQNFGGWQIRIAPVQFASTGTIAGPVSGWRTAPPHGGGPDVKYVYQDRTSAASLALPTLVAATTGIPNPYSIPNPVQLQLTLRGGPSATPFVYGAIAHYNSVSVSTAAPNTDVTPYLAGASIEVQDSIGGTHATIRLRNPAAIADLGSPSLITMCNRAFELRDSSGVIGSYVASAPIVEDDFGYSEADHEAAMEIELQGRDGWKLAEDYEFGDPLPLDTLSLAGAFTEIAKRIGFGCHCSAAASSLFINASGVPAGGEWNYEIDVGDRGSEAIKKLHETYVPNWWLGLTFGGEAWTLNVLEAADMPSSSSVTLYRSVKDAMDVGGFDLASAPYFVYRSLKWHVLEPEASQAWTVGEDFRTGRPILVGKTDDDASDPAYSVDSRPDNWIGYLKKCSFGTDSLTTLTDVQAANDLYFARVTAARTLYEIGCEYLDGIAPGALVTLSKALEFDPSSNTGTDVMIRIKTFSGSFEQVAGGGAQWRPCRYVGEDSSVVAPLGVGGTSIRAIRNNWALKQLSKARMELKAAETGWRPAINIQVS